MRGRLATCTATAGSHGTPRPPVAPVHLAIVRQAGQPRMKGRHCVRRQDREARRHGRAITNIARNIRSPKEDC
eukprot:5211803-Pyramimonas_sp.AAC.1